MYSWKTACELIIIYNFYNLCQDFAAGTNIKSMFWTRFTVDSRQHANAAHSQIYLILEILNAILCLNTLCRPDLKMYKLWIGFVVQSVSSRILLTSDRKWRRAGEPLWLVSILGAEITSRRITSWLLSVEWGPLCTVLESGRSGGWRLTVSTKIRGTQYTKKGLLDPSPCWKISWSFMTKRFPISGGETMCQSCFW